MKIAVCYLTRINGSLDFNFNHLVNHIKTSHQQIDIYKYVNDDTFNDYVKDNISTSINHQCVQYNIKFSWNILRSQFNYYQQFFNATSQVLYNAGVEILVLLDLFVKYQNYDYYIFYEDDVLLNTNKNLFDNIDYNHDVLFQYPRGIDYKWWWWMNDESHNIKDLLKPYCGLLNIYGCKPDILDQFMTNIIFKGYYAHHELLFNGFVCDHYNDMTYLCDQFKIYMEYKIYPKAKIDKTYEIIHPIKSIDKYIKYKGKHII